MKIGKIEKAYFENKCRCVVCRDMIAVYLRLIEFDFDSAALFSIYD